MATIHVALRFWRAHVKKLGNPTVNSDILSRYLPLSPREIDALTDRLSKVREAPLLEGGWSPGCVQVPTFFGHQENRALNQAEFDEPLVSVLIGEADGLRLILGTDDPEDDEKPDIHIERRPRGWAFFVHPNAADPVAMIYLLDDGRTFVMPELYADPRIEQVYDIPAELDAL
jgi:hypothetical protein